MNVIEMEVSPERVGVLIGKDGEVKKSIEEKTGCRLMVDSKSGVVKIECDDAIGFMRARDTVRAISYGFPPDVALRLLDEDMTMLEVIDLTNYVSEKALQRVKGRIIGKEGKMRKQIEDVLGVRISIQGKYVAILGDVENVSAAREAVMMLVEGAQHSTVMKFMERKRREMRSRVLDWI